jgi:hypothetical protein
MGRLVFQKRFVVGMMVLALCLSSGCKAKMGRYAVRVQLDPSLAGKSIEVHLVGVNNTDYAKWHDYSMTSYWKHEDPLRTTAVQHGIAKVMRFGQGLPTVQSIDIKDPIFKEWKGRKVEHLFILTNLVSTGVDKPGTADFRRGILPLTTKHWNRGEIRKRRGIEVTITASGPDVKPQPKVKK